MVTNLEVSNCNSKGWTQSQRPPLTSVHRVECHSAWREGSSGSQGHLCAEGEKPDVQSRAIQGQKADVGVMKSHTGGRDSRTKQQHLKGARNTTEGRILVVGKETSCVCTWCPGKPEANPHRGWWVLPSCACHVPSLRTLGLRAVLHHIFMLGPCFWGPGKL